MYTREIRVAVAAAHEVDGMCCALEPFSRIARTPHRTTSMATGRFFFVTDARSVTREVKQLRSVPAILSQEPAGQ